MIRQGFPAGAFLRDGASWRRPDLVHELSQTGQGILLVRKHISLNLIVNFSKNSNDLALLYAASNRLIIQLKHGAKYILHNDVIQMSLIVVISREYRAGVPGAKQ
jgi:hypothetical protein